MPSSFLPTVYTFRRRYVSGLDCAGPAFSDYRVPTKFFEKVKSVDRFTLLIRFISFPSIGVFCFLSYS